MEEKVIKPVPDVEALRYKGTPEKPDIKIFVSHRIDLDSETIDNPLYIPVRCGATFDDRENVDMLGDDTGDNISEKRLSYCELTVQYWAWKNVEADYYGLCHYRRYLSFKSGENQNEDKYQNESVHVSEKPNSLDEIKDFEEFKEFIESEKNEKIVNNKKAKHSEKKEEKDTPEFVLDGFNHYIANAITEKNVEKFGMVEEKMRETITQYDIIGVVPAYLDKIENAKPVAVFESLEKNPTTFPIEAIKIFIRIVKEKYPSFAQDVDEYFGGYEWRAFNCYILKKEFFNEYCEMCFSVLNQFDREVDCSKFNQEQLRTAGYMGEVLFGIYWHHLRRQNAAKLLETNVVRFDNTTKCREIIPAFDSRNIPVVMASSNEYVPFLSVVLNSIQKNSKASDNYDIIVIGKNISDYRKKILSDMVQAYDNFSIRFIDAQAYLAGWKFHTAMHVTEMTYLRLAMLDIMKNYDKAIYLDCDIVVNWDLADLFYTDIGDNYVAAARDTIMAGWCNSDYDYSRTYNERFLGLKSSDKYFNAGILLFNLSEMRKHISSEDLLEMAQKKNWKWFDQDVLNIVCENHVYMLDNAWNILSHRHTYDYEMAEFFAPYSVWEEYKKAQKEPKIIHYAGRFIPCFVPDTDLAEYFWKYARNTPFYELILSSMAQNQIGIASQMLRQPSHPRGLDAYGIVNKAFPYGSRRRSVFKKVMPRDSFLWNVCKKVYHIFKK